jgi:hypothetical protein
MDRGELEGLDRESLVVEAQAAGIRRARILTRPELIDELLRLDPGADEESLRKSRGFFGRARDLVARVVERGLHLPDAAERIRTLATGPPPPPSVPRPEPQAMPTVTLAEIYAAQGHSKRALETLRRVLEREPDHAVARALLARLEDAAYVAPPPPLPPEPEIEPEPADSEGDADEPTMPSAIVAGLPVAGPSYDDGAGAEFHLVPSDEHERQAPPSYDTRLPYADTAVHKVLPDVPPRAPVVVFANATARSPFLTVADLPPKAPSVVPAEEDDAAPPPVAPAPVAPAAPVALTPIAPDAPVALVGDAALLALAAEADEVDECLAIPMPRDDAGGRTFVSWRVSFGAIGEQLGARPHGRFVVRAYIVTPSWDGPRSETRDRMIDPDLEQIILEALPEPSVVRVAVGWLDGTTFLPFAHSPALELTRGRVLGIWTTHGVTPIALGDPRAAAFATALAASRRAAEARS